MNVFLLKVDASTPDEFDPDDIEYAVFRTAPAAQRAAVQRAGTALDWDEPYDSVFIAEHANVAYVVEPVQFVGE